MECPKIDETNAQISESTFAAAYQKGFNRTLRFLLSRGVPQDLALDSAQAAWTRAWERRAQLRNPALVLTWVNSIALNVYRTTMRTEPHTEEMVDIECPSQHTHLAAIDVERILTACRPTDRIVLEDHYIRGFKLEEIAEQNNWSEKAVRLRLFRARKKIRDLVASGKKLRFLHGDAAGTMDVQEPLQLCDQAA